MESVEMPNIVSANILHTWDNNSRLPHVSRASKPLTYLITTDWRIAFIVATARHTQHRGCTINPCQTIHEDFLITYSRQKHNFTFTETGQM